MDGKDHRESSGSTVKADAIDLLNQRIAEGPKEQARRVRSGTVTFADLAAGLRLDYDLKGRKSKNMMELSLRHLECAFDGWVAEDIDARAIKSYAAERKRKAQPATINRELAALRRAFRIAADDGLVDSVPAIPRLKEDNVRRVLRAEPVPGRTGAPAGVAATADRRCIPYGMAAGRAPIAYLGARRLRRGLDQARAWRDEEREGTAVPTHRPGPRGT